LVDNLAGVQGGGEGGKLCRGVVGCGGHESYRDALSSNRHTGWGEAKKRTVTGRVYRLWDWYWFGRLGQDSCTAAAGMLAEAGEPHNLKIRKDVWRRVVCGGPARGCFRC
jgi:hypothetical protein